VGDRIAAYADRVASLTTSKSVRLLAVVLLLGSLVTAATTVPRLLRSEAAVVDVQPQLLRVDEIAKGVVPLGEGLTVSMYDSGLQVRRADRVIFETVRTGSVLSAGTGTVTGTGDSRKEEVVSTMDSLHILEVRTAGPSATYIGKVFGPDATVPSLPVSIRVTRVGRGFELEARARDADLLVLHTERPQAPVGVPPSSPGRTLAKNAWWLPRRGGGPVTVMTSASRGNRTTTALGTSADAVLDLRHDGRGEIHVWDRALRLQVR